jgi:hypothetical protein
LIQTSEASKSILLNDVRDMMLHNVLSSLFVA